MTDLVLREDRDGLAVLTLNRPDKLNAYTAQMGRELAEGFRRADVDDAVVAGGFGRIEPRHAGRVRPVGEDASPRDVSQHET